MLEKGKSVNESIKCHSVPSSPVSIFQIVAIPIISCPTQLGSHYLSNMKISEEILCYEAHRMPTQCPIYERKYNIFVLAYHGRAHIEHTESLQDTACRTWSGQPHTLCLG